MASNNENLNFVWAVYDNEDAAVAAGKSLKSWDKVNDDVKLGAIGVLHMSDKGKLKVKKMGPRTTGKGALIGVTTGALVAIFAPADPDRWRCGRCLGRFTQKGLGSFGRVERQNQGQSGHG